MRVRRARSLIKYFGCGNLYSDGNKFIFKVTKFGDIIQRIIPFFLNHKIKGEKVKDFADLCKVASMMKEKKHLGSLPLRVIPPSSRGGESDLGGGVNPLDQIKKIKASMNSKRQTD